MKIIVIGYGRVGSQFIKKVDKEAHRVVVIDKAGSVLEGTALPEGVRFRPPRKKPLEKFCWKAELVRSAHK